MDKPEWIDQQMFELDKKEKEILNFLTTGNPTTLERVLLTKIRTNYLLALEEFQNLWRLQK